MKFMISYIPTKLMPLRYEAVITVFHLSRPVVH